MTSQRINKLLTLIESCAPPLVRYKAKNRILKEIDRLHKEIVRLESYEMMERMR